MWINGELIETQYRNEIREILNNPKKFSVFKSLSLYRAVIGGSYDHEILYMAHKLKKEFPDLWNGRSEFSSIDRVGTPPRSVLPCGISMDLVRYLDSLRNIKHHIGSLDGMRVNEFGAGYGGLAFVLMKEYNIQSYNIVDLPEPMELAKRCLALENMVVTTNEIKECDLFIGEYSITEMVEWRDLMVDYCKPAGKVFIRCNLPDKQDRLQFEGILSQWFDKVLVIPEEPSTRSPNHVIIGCK